MTLSPSNMTDPESDSVLSLAIFNLGFRPFFLFAGIASLLLIPFWIYIYAYGNHEFTYYSPLIWHSHEMIFGYTVAVVAGFLLTAVRNWTGIQTPSGKALAGLVGLWLAGRLLPFVPGVLPHWLIAVVDTAFVPVLAITLSIPLVRSLQTHNAVFLLVLAALTCANLMVHFQVLGFTETSANLGLNFAVYLVVLLITILGGRVIPFFTEKGIPGATTRERKSVEIASIGTLLALMALDLGGAAPLAVVIVSAVAAIAHGTRLWGWYQKPIWSVPLLWVLQLGYAWLVVGFILKALSAAGWVNPMLAIHAFTTGGIGTITLGMMARVSLGHTGRALQVGAAMTWAFVLVNMAAVSRVFLPLLSPSNYTVWLVSAAALWCVAFTLFVISYSAVLLRPRVDGRPG